MKRLSLLILVLLVCGFLGVQNIQAAMVGLGFDGTETDIDGKWNGFYKGYYSETEEWTGYYIATKGENDSESLLETLATEYLGTLFDGEYAKVDSPSGTSGYLTTTSALDELSGTWSTDYPYELGFYAVKAGPQFALYYVFPYTSSGNWSTTHLEVGNGNQPEISHLSASAAQVPIPGAVWLLGSGLFGIVGLRKKLRK